MICFGKAQMVKKSDGIDRIGDAKDGHGTASSELSGIGPDKKSEALAKTGSAWFAKDKQGMRWHRIAGNSNGVEQIRDAKHWSCVD